MNHSVFTRSDKCSFAMILAVSVALYQLIHANSTTFCNYDCQGTCWSGATLSTISMEEICQHWQVKDNNIVRLCYTILKDNKQFKRRCYLRQKWSSIVLKGLLQMIIFFSCYDNWLWFWATLFLERIKNCTVHLFCYHGYQTTRVHDGYSINFKVYVTKFFQCFIY